MNKKSEQKQEFEFTCVILSTRYRRDCVIGRKPCLALHKIVFLLCFAEPSCWHVFPSKCKIVWRNKKTPRRLSQNIYLHCICAVYQCNSSVCLELLLPCSLMTPAKLHSTCHRPTSTKPTLIHQCFQFALGGLVWLAQSD